MRLAKKIFTLKHKVDTKWISDFTKSNGYEIFPITFPPMTFLITAKIFFSGIKKE